MDSGYYTDNIHNFYDILFLFSGGKVLILIGMEFTHMSKDHKLGKNNNLDFVDNINVT